MIKLNTFDRFFYVYRYLRDSLLSPAYVDMTDISFINGYVQEFNAEYTENLFGMKQCSELKNILDKMTMHLILKREKMALNPWLENNHSSWTWRFCLDNHAHTIMDGYQDYFLNSLARKNKC